jgi:cathepsin L
MGERATVNFVYLCHYCSGGTGGCNGATSELGFQYVADKGIASEKDYPYKGQTGKCDETKPKSAKVHSFVKLPENNYTALISAVATIGPIAVSVDAEPWMSYSSGIFTGCGFNRIDINHAVQAVGYGSQNGKDYWSMLYPSPT